MPNEQHAPLSIVTTFDANAAFGTLSNSYGRCVKLAAGGLAVSGANERVLGTLKTVGKIDEALLVETRRGSRAIAISGAAVARPARLRSDASGRLVTAAANEHADALCFEGAGAADRRISVILMYTPPTA